jgi:hypothetical protein
MRILLTTESFLPYLSGVTVSVDALEPREVEPALPDLYRRSRRKAELALARHGEAAIALPDTCPYALDNLIADEWWPANRHGLDEET